MKRKRAGWVYAIVVIALIAAVLVARHLPRRPRPPRVSPVAAGPSGAPFLSDLRLRIAGVTLALPGDRFSVRAKDLSVRSLLSTLERQTLAFAGPAEIMDGARSRSVNVSGTISGNMKTGAVSIGKTTVQVKDLGEAEISGSLENWGKDGAAVNAVVRSLSIKDLAKFLALAIPADGQAQGTLAFHFGQKEKINRVDFDLAIDRLHTEQSPLFHGNLKGTYDLAGKKAVVNGALESPQKESISFAARIAGDDFTATFDSRGLTVETILQFLPAELRKKLGAEGKGTVSLKDFSLEKQGRGYAWAGNLNLDAPELKLANFPLHDVVAALEGVAGKTCRGDYAFSLFGGTGRGLITVAQTGGTPALNISFSVSGIELAAFSRALNDQLLVTGILDVEGSCMTDKDRQEMILTFRTREKRGVKQTLNVGAVKAIAALGGAGSAVGSIGRADFHYAKLAGRVTLRNGYLTVEGLAGEQGDNQYLLKAPLFGQGVNVLVHGRTNTIRLEHFKELLARALRSAV